MSLSFESGSYGLRQVSSGDKTVLLMKLTDSALRIIESYLNNAGNIRSKPNIQFQGNQGVIQIPVHGDGEVQQFSFQVSTQPAFDCLQQIKTSHSEKVEYLGTVEQKITINANDDSYKTTRKRVELAKQEEQKTSTKVIKQPGSKIGKAYKKMPKNRLMDKSSHISSKSKSSPDTRAPTPPMSRLAPSHNRSSSPLTLSGKDRSISPPIPGMGRNKTKPTINYPSGQKGGSSPNTMGNTAVAAKPLPQRIAHLLALRPYKYPEIVLRLQRDRQPDKSRLQDALSKVATSRNTQGVGMEYCLMRSQYPHLEPDTWPGYTDAERKAVKKKIADMQQTSEIRKRPHPSARSPPEIFAEMHIEDEYSNPTSKKQRVSHIKRRSSESSPLQPETSKSRSPGNSSISFGTTQLIPKDQNQPSTSRRISPSPDKNKSSSRPSPEYHERRSPLIPSSDNVMEWNGNPELLSSPEVFLPSPEEDYLKKYTEISSDEQRNRYKNDFYAEYDEYLKHHHSLSEVAKKFTIMRDRLRQYERGSDGYIRVAKEVVQEYKKIKRDLAYHREKTRCIFLHRKLQHIKELVHAFDDHKLANNRPQSHSQFSMQPATKVA